VDRHLRSQQRAFLSGDPGAAGRLWCDALRAGSIAPMWLRRAAHLGLPLALHCLGQEPAPVDEAWFEALDTWGGEVPIRAATALVRRYAQGDLALWAVCAAEAWLAQPCAVTGELAAQVAAGAWDADETRDWSSGAAADLAWAVAWMEDEAISPDRECQLLWRMTHYSPQRVSLEYSRQVLRQLLEDREVGSEQARASVAAELLPWLLAQALAS
jgi:hypothetical protein